MPIKRILSNRVKKARPNYVPVTEIHFRCNDSDTLQVKGWKGYTPNSTVKAAGPV